MQGQTLTNSGKLKKWYELYSNFSLILQPIIKSLLKNKWKQIFNQPKRFETTEAWSDFSNQIWTITDPKERFLSAVSYVILGISAEDEIKTIRPCFPINLEDFKKTFFPNLKDDDYLKAQFALTDMSYEAFIGKYYRSLTSEIIEGRQHRYFPNIEQVRMEGRSVRTDVDKIVGFNCLVYIPIIPDKLWLLFFSPIHDWFTDDVGKILTKSINKILGKHIQLIELYWDAIQFLEQKTKEMWFISFNRAIDILYHPFRAKEQNEDARKFFYGIVKSFGLDILTHALNPQRVSFDLNSKFKETIQADNQLRAVINDNLRFDLNKLPVEQILVRGDPDILKLAIWEAVDNARKYGEKTEIAFNKYETTDTGKIANAGISFKSKIKGGGILVEEYMQLRFGIPLVDSDKVDADEGSGIGLWLVNRLLTAMGGYVSVKLNDFNPTGYLEVQLWFEKI